MKSININLDNDLSQSFSKAFFVIKAELDEGNFYYSSGHKNVGSTALNPAIVSLGEIDTASVKFVLNKGLVDSSITWWVNRPVKIYQVVEESISATDGYLAFEGVILNQPDEVLDNLSFVCGPSRFNPIVLPESDVIDGINFPNASQDALNKVPPVIYGTVGRAPLLPTNVPVITALKTTARTGDAHLLLGNTKNLPASGPIIVDGKAYNYTSKDTEGVYGVQVSDEHQAGTQVSTPGGATYLAAEHLVASITNVKAIAAGALATESFLFNGVIDEAAATVFFPSPPTVEQVVGSSNVFIQFDEVGLSNTALNTINSIQAATGTQNQSASSLPIGINDVNPLDIPFPFHLKAGGTNRIISASYSVGFNVDVLFGIPNLGRTVVTIGGVVAWVWNGGSVVYNANPITLPFDRDLNELPVRVILDGAQSTAFTVNITSATRTIITGNLDQAAFATLRKPSNTDLVINQTTVNPDRGKITRAQLVVEHFSTSQDLDNVSVFYDTQKIGELSSKNDPGGQSVHTINIDTVSNGTATLINTAITNALTSNVSKTDNAVSVPVNVPIGYTVKEVTGAPSQTVVYALDTEIALPERVVGGSYNFTITSNSAAGGINNTSEASLDGTVFSPSGGTQIINITLLDNQTSMTLVHDSDLVFGNGAFSTSLFSTIKNIRGTVQAKPSENAITLTEGTPTGTLGITNGTSNVSGVQSAANIDGTGTGTLTVVIPAPPRTVINTFDLMNVESWSDLTNKEVKLTYAGIDSDDVGIVRVFFAIDFERIVQAPAHHIIADIKGKSENPADILKDLLEKNGQVVENNAYLNFKNYADTQGYQFSRRIEKKIEVATLVNTAAMQANVMLADQQNGVSMIRLDDTTPVPTTIMDSDLLKPAQISWSSSEDIENHLTLQYQLENNHFTKAITLSKATPNQILLDSFNAIGFERKIEFEGGWIYDDVTAQIFLNVYAKFKAPMRRFLSLELPYSFGRLEPGDLIFFNPLQLQARITNIVNDNGWISLDAESMPAII